MNKKLKFTLISTWIIFSRSFDAYCTNQLTPDLSKESNPLVSVFGMGWTPLLLIIGLLSLYAIYTYYKSVFKPMDLLPKEKGYSKGNILAYAYLGEKEHWTSVLYKFPKSLSRFNQFMGQTLSICLSYAGAVSTLMWLLIRNVDAYKSIHSPLLVYSVLILGCLALIYQWNHKRYQEYLNLAYQKI